MPEEKQDDMQEKPRRGDRWVLWLIFFLFAGGLAIRGYSYMTDGTSQTTRRISSSKSIPTFQDGSPGHEQKKTFADNSRDAGGFNLLTDLAPYLTEGGLSFFLGFCLGFFLRVVAKTAAFVVGGLYIALILLSHYGLITVDWGNFQHLLQQLLLNTRDQVEGLQGILTVGIPSVAMGGLGIWRGLKKA